MRLPAENIKTAREVQLVDFLNTYRPGELVRKSRDEYCTKSHSSLRITPSKNLFHWCSQSKGGRGALDYLLTVEGMSFRSAVIRRKINPKLEIDGVLITMADHRTNMTRDMIKAIHTSYGAHTRIYQAIVPRCTRVSESLTCSESVLRYSKKCPASTAYRALAKEVEKGARSREKHPSALDR